MPPPPVAHIATPAGLYLLPSRPLDPQQCEELAAALAEHAERQRGG